MPRSIRIEYPGALYHVMARGNRRERIFRDDDDRRFLLKTLAEAGEMTGWRVHAWVFMSNHYHLLIQTPEPNLVAGMKWLQNTYTRRFNIRHRFWGRLFGDRYKTVPVEGAGYYYETLLDYIHLNPVRAGSRARISANIKGSEPRKVAIARVIRERTVMNLVWIADRLSMRSAANVSQQIRRQPKAEKECKTGVAS